MPHIFDTSYDIQSHNKLYDLCVISLPQILNLFTMCHLIITKNELKSEKAKTDLTLTINY